VEQMMVVVELAELQQIMDVLVMIPCIVMELIHIPAVHVHLTQAILAHHRLPVTKPQILVIQQELVQSQFLMAILIVPTAIRQAE
jgi:hypothetical protein